ncbi:hypothetical protein ICN46_11405 [Polynucleobacter sp. Latsch14-2]|nr:hypothetical protein [Polynucleobacter sp. Latsch14-2]MBU3615496.1 hypothetical protein [Polynucleobacter sp. Latsch14-2]
MSRPAPVAEAELQETSLRISRDEDHAPPHTSSPRVLRHRPVVPVGV